MKIDARLSLFDARGPDPWDDSVGVQLPLDHIICREIDGTPHSVGEFAWPWSAYTKHRARNVLHFYYWNRKRGKEVLDNLEVSQEREARIRELQFLMTRQIYYGSENATQTLVEKLVTLHRLARFAESKSCTVRDVLTESSLLDACGSSMSGFAIRMWMGWIKFLQQLDPSTQLGFKVATPKKWKDLERRVKYRRNNGRQHAPLPTRIYSELINNLSTELDDIEAHTPSLLAALREALVQHAAAKSTRRGNVQSIGPALITRHSLVDYLSRRGFNVGSRALNQLSGAISEAFLVCKLQIHVFSGMRHDEARTLPYHCMVTEQGSHGRTHSLISGVTTKYSKGRHLRTHWVTTDRDGFRAIRLAQQFASVIYESLGLTPSRADDDMDRFPLFPSVNYLPWVNNEIPTEQQMQAPYLKLNAAKDLLRSRLIPIIEEDDIAELEEIDPLRGWCDEPAFAIGQRWPLTTHQLRRSLAIYANASGLVSLTSLRRQLQHVTREMSFFYGRGSTFCKNFVASDPMGYKKHLAPEWQDGESEAEMLAFTRDVLNCEEPMFGGAGSFYQRQKDRGVVMTREEVQKKIKAGLLSYTPSPLGGCTKSGGCERRKGLAMVDISCATDCCKNLVGKHSKIVRVIQLKRAAIAHINPRSIEAGIEKEELEALERVEREWRQPSRSSSPKGRQHA